MKAIRGLMSAAVMMSLLGALLTAVVLALTGCSSEDAPKTDGEDYKGPPQAIAAKRIDEQVMGLRTKSESYCTSYKNGTCKTRGTRVKIETYVADDKDWVLILADGTEVDVDQHTWDRKQVGEVYP